MSDFDAAADAAAAEVPPAVEPAAEPTPKLTYFGLAARGELAKLLAAVGGLEIEINTCDMGAHTAYARELGMPGSLPVLEHGDLKLCQSLAIEAYITAIAPDYKLLTPKQLAIDNLFAGLKEDLVQAIAKVLFAPDEAKPKLLEDLPATLNKLYGCAEGLLPDEGFMHGGSAPSGADLACLVISKGQTPFVGGMKVAGYYDAFATNYPKITRVAAAAEAYPAVAKYLEEHTTLTANPFGLP